MARLDYLDRDDIASDYLYNYVRNNIYSGDSFMIKKLAQYRLFWKFYDNKHWNEENGILMSFNYCKAIVNKVNEFTIGSNGFETNVIHEFGEEVPENIERSVESLINYTWKKSGGNILLSSLLQMGGVTGDGYMFVYYNATRGLVEIKLLDTRFVVAKFNNGDYKDVIGYDYVTPLFGNKKEYKQKVTEYRKGKYTTYYKKETGEKADKFEPLETPVEDGELPIIHIENNVNSGDFGGYSDLQDILALNKVYNELAEDIKKIIDYYTTPVTIIKGAKIGNLQRGIGQIWSGLPAEASVQTLGLGEDLGNAKEFMETVKKAMHDLTGVPEEVLSKVQHISNTSNAALKTLYNSLTMASDRKVLTYGYGIEKVNALALKLWLRYNPTHPLVTEIESSRELIENEVYTTDPVFTYGLPNDRMTTLQEGQIELQTKTGSRRSIMERLGTKNIPKMIAEIDAEEKKYAENTEPSMRISQDKLKNS